MIRLQETPQPGAWEGLHIEGTQKLKKSTKVQIF